MPTSAPKRRPRRLEASCHGFLHRQSLAAPPAMGFLAKSVRLMEPQRSLTVLRLPAAAAGKPWGRTLCALHAAAEGEDGVRAVAVTAAGNLFEYSVQVGALALVTLLEMAVGNEPFLLHELLCSTFVSLVLLSKLLESAVPCA